MADFENSIAKELNIPVQNVKSTAKLLADNTVPFITRYRKEMTGGLDEEQIRAIQEKLTHHRMLQERKSVVIEQIRSQGKLTRQLEEKILGANKLKIVEDIYLPYKPKKRTLATIARERGLGPVAEKLWRQELSLADEAEELSACINPENELNTLDDVRKGIRHILAEIVSEQARVREKLRVSFAREGILETCATKEGEQKKEQSKFRDYFEFSQKVNDIPLHRVLAINRGEKEKALRVYLRTPDEQIIADVCRLLIRTKDGELYQMLQEAVEDSYRRLLHPSISREIRRDLTEKAERHAIEVFAGNLRKVLLSPPVRDKKILGIDPGFRTGCKWAVIDEFGKLLEVGVIYPHPPQSKKEQAKITLAKLVKKYAVPLLVIGNGTAHRETEEIVSELIAENDFSVRYAIVSEAGASVYSASQQAREEFPDLEASYRGTVSIARRLQDPLSEIVKIDPKSMGVGLYQHDVDQKRLAIAVDNVVESCVNYVGVDLNTASVSLLEHISGLKKSKAQKIYDWRIENGGFQRRKDLLKVKGIGKDTFVQAAGFLKIPDGDEPLDNTQIHPESYQKTRELLARMEINPSEFDKPGFRSKLLEKLSSLDVDRTALELDIGAPTLRDIVKNLEKPGRDPRDELPEISFRKGVLKLDDLKIGMEFQGTVRNVVDFGAFVDIGVKEDGLVHISQISDRFINSPMEALSVGDIVKVRVIGIDLQRGRISLSMRSESRQAKRKD